MKNQIGSTKISPYIYPGLQEKIQMELNIKRLKSKKPEIGNCYMMICESLNFNPEDISKKTGVRDIVKKRQLIIYILNTEYKFILKQIGKLFGNMHHSTIIHSRDIIANLLQVSDFDTKNLMKVYLANKNIIKYRYGIE